MERLKNMKECLMDCVQNQISGNLHDVNTEELGAAVDMIKDLSEAIYYCSITKAMEEKEEEEKYSSKMMAKGYNYNMPRMYYDGRNNSSRHGDDKEEYYPYPSEIRDYREGKSPITRRNYMESKELKHGREKQIQELEKYMKELTDDILEMIEDATPEEKMILSQKLSVLSGKI